MGTAFATRLRLGGYSLVGFDLDPKSRDAFARLGGTVAGSAADVAKSCARIILSLPSHVEVGDALAAADGAWREGQVVIDTTTGDPGHSETIAAKLGRRGVAYLDATLSGNSAQVKEGAATVMVGGDAAAFAACRDIFQQLGTEIFHTGASGTGARMKLVTNLVLGLNRAALAEGLALAETMGLEPEMTLRVMKRSPAYSRMMDVKGEKMIRSEFSPDARLSQHLKDVRLILAKGEAAGLPMTLSVAHREVLEAAEAAGLGALDNSALIEVLRGKVLVGAPPRPASNHRGPQARHPEGGT